MAATEELLKEKVQTWTLKGSLQLQVYVGMGSWKECSGTLEELQLGLTQVGLVSNAHQDTLVTRH